MEEGVVLSVPKLQVLLTIRELAYCEMLYPIQSCSRWFKKVQRFLSYPEES
jgi:hypothetical protein